MNRLNLIFVLSVLLALQNIGCDSFPKRENILPGDCMKAAWFKEHYRVIEKLKNDKRSIKLKSLKDGKIKIIDMFDTDFKEVRCPD